MSTPLTPHRRTGSITRVWLGLVLLVLGVLGALDAVDVLSSGSVVARWWPVAVIGWAALEMALQRRVSVGYLAVVALGVVLLADSLELNVAALLWSLLLVSLGALLLVHRERRSPPDGGPDGGTEDRHDRWTPAGRA